MKPRETQRLDPHFRSFLSSSLRTSLVRKPPLPSTRQFAIFPCSITQPAVTSATVEAVILCSCRLASLSFIPQFSSSLLLSLLPLQSLHCQPQHRSPRPRLESQWDVSLTAAPSMSSDLKKISLPGRKTSTVKSDQLHLLGHTSPFVR